MNLTVPELLNAASEKAQALNISVPELLHATEKYIKEAPANINASVPEILQSAGKYIQENPGTFALQAGGITVALAAFLVVPILGAAGFGATGPVARTAAAAWHSSIGLVEAGSFFAWCQSAAMGGAAFGGIVAAGASGLGVAGAATVSRVEQVRDRFGGFFANRKEDGKEVVVVKNGDEEEAEGPEQGTLEGEGKLEEGVVDEEAPHKAKL